MQEIALQESKDICGGGNVGWLTMLSPLAYVICAGVKNNSNPAQWC